MNHCSLLKLQGNIEDYSFPTLERCIAIKLLNLNNARIFLFLSIASSTLTENKVQTNGLRSHADASTQSCKKNDALLICAINYINHILNSQCYLTVFNC